MAAQLGRFKELVRKYGKVALGVHCTVSAASVSGLYIAINSNVDVESILEKWHLAKKPDEEQNHHGGDGISGGDDDDQSSSKSRNRTAEIAGSTGGALALALLCNKALFPIRVPITIALTPPISRLLVRRGIIKNTTLRIVIARKLKQNPQLEQFLLSDNQVTELLIFRSSSNRAAHI